MKVLVLGAAGLLGHTIFAVLSETPGWRVSGTVRDDASRRRLPTVLADRAIVAGDLSAPVTLRRTIEDARPDAVVNCLSVSRSALREDNFAGVVAALSVLPQRIALECRRVGARMVHFSSDGVFSGTRGNYAEDDVPDAADVYGVAKFLGEVRDPHTFTIRTSMIGHELGRSTGLLEWFLAQQERATCFRRAIFSGLPTPELGAIVRGVLLSRVDLSGVYHVAAAPISKYDLLRLVADIYGKRIEIVPDDRVVIDRSLNAERFAAATGYRAPAWPALVQSMHAHHLRASA